MRGVGKVTRVGGRGKEWGESQDLAFYFRIDPGTPTDLGLGPAKTWSRVGGRDVARSPRVMQPLRPGHGPGLLEGHVPSWGLAVAAESPQLSSGCMEVGPPLQTTAAPITAQKGPKKGASSLTPRLGHLPGSEPYLCPGYCPSCL